MLNLPGQCPSVLLQVEHMKKLDAEKPRRPGRPSKADSELGPSAKVRILETALRLFYQHGIHSVGIDRIIAESQIAKMTFFKHFPTKRELILEFLKVRDERYIGWFVDTLNQLTADKKKRLAAAIDVVEIWFKSKDFRGCAFINTTAEVGSGDMQEKNLCVAHKRRLTELLEQLASEAGYHHAPLLAEQLVTVIDGATVRAQMEGAEAGIHALRCTSKAILKMHKS